MSDTKHPSWAVGGRKAVHFGFFLRRRREEKNLSRARLGKLVAGYLPDGKERGFSEKRIFDIEKMQTPKVRERTFLALGRALGYETGEAFDTAWRSTPVEPYVEGEGIGSDESAAARLLAGEAVMLEELKAAAAAKGMGLGELFRTISREWLAARATPGKAFHGVHLEVDAIRQPPASARPKGSSRASPSKPARAPRAAGRRAGRGK